MTYTLEQLYRLELLAFQDDWKEAFEYMGFYEDSLFFSKSIVKLGILKFTKEYFSCPSEIKHIEGVVHYLINKFYLNY